MRHLVDPELLPLLDMLPQLDLNVEVLPKLRSRAFAPPLPKIVDNDIERRDFTVPGPAGAPDIQLVTYTPPGPGPFPCIYHMHGGGFVSGSAGILEFMHRPLAEELHCVIVSVNYRLAPETCFPGNIEDCYTGLAWTVTNAAELNVDPARVGLMGESAGGGLALALALMARDRGEYALAFQVLSYPMIDDRTCIADSDPHAGPFVWTRANNCFGWSSLLGGEPGGEDVSPYAAPARASDLSGLPPTFVMTGGLDLFVDEIIVFVRRLAAAGVPTEFHLYPRAFHAFDSSPSAAVAMRARGDRAHALRDFLG